MKVEGKVGFVCRRCTKAVTASSREALVFATRSHLGTCDNRAYLSIRNSFFQKLRKAKKEVE